MHILFVSHYFPPEVNAPATRTYEHCRHWLKAGHRVTVVTCAPNHPQGKLYPGYKNRLFQRQQIDGIELVRVWTLLSANEGFLLRTLNYVSFMISACLASLRLPKVDLLITTSPQFFNGLAGYPISRMKRVPWILEIRDLWPESILAVGALSNRRIIAALHWLEKLAYRKAQQLVVVTDAFKQYMLRQGVAENRVEVIKNGVNLDFYNPEALPQPLADELKPFRGKFVVAYVGTHGMAHRLETILAAAEQLKDDPDIAFLLAGDGAERSRLLAKKQQMGLTNLSLLGQLPKEHMPQIWRLTSVSLVLLRKNDLFKTVIPSKIFESMAMRVPIILGVEGEAAALLSAAEAGLCIEPENAQQLAEAILRLKQDKDLHQRLGQNGRQFVQAEFNRETLARRFLTVAERLVEEQKLKLGQPKV